MACLLAALTPARAAAQASAPKEQVKAAFLFDFTKFVDWPASAFAGARSPFVMAVLGDATLAALLERVVAGETAKGRPIAVERIARPQDLPPCQLLYVSDAQRRRLKEALARVRGEPVLTVAEMPGFNRAGGIINFEVRGGKLGFAINKAAADEAGLKISSQLLGLALNTRELR